MTETGTTQTLLSCMGYRLGVVQRPFRPTLTRSVERSWTLHRQLSTHLSTETLEGWRPTIVSNLDRLSRSVQGQPHTRNLDRWRHLIDEGDITGIRRAVAGLDTDSTETREAPLLGGLLPESERRRLLAAAD